MAGGAEAEGYLTPAACVACVQGKAGHEATSKGAAKEMPVSDARKAEMGELLVSEEMAPHMEGKGQDWECDGAGGWQGRGRDRMGSRPRGRAGLVEHSAATAQGEYMVRRDVRWAARCRSGWNAGQGNE